MMDRAWLDLRREKALEPDLPIVDAHHHLWRVAGRYGRYELADLRYDTSLGHRIEATVFIECGAEYLPDGPTAHRPVGETVYVAERAAEAARTPGPPIAAIVGHADLSLGAEVGDILDRHLAEGDGRFRGVRHSGARADDPAVPSTRCDPPADLYALAGFRAGARALAARNLSFEAWQYHYQLDTVADLARAVPELTIVVNHLGGPLGVGRWADRGDEVAETLRRGLTALAPLPNVVLKLGGIGMTRFGADWHTRDLPPSSADLAAVWGDLLRFGIDAFGPSRCMFESNYPVDGETVGYEVLWNAFKLASAAYSPSERADLFAGTARRVYGIPHGE